MKEINNLDFEITQISIDKIKEIKNNMISGTFHLHTHILYDIRTSFGDTDDIVYLEIGTYAGASSSLIASHPFKTKCFALDLGHPIKKEVVEENVNRFKNPKSTFEYIQGNSMENATIEKTHSIIPFVNILFIDGDHSRDGVFSDFQNYSDLVKKNGYICFDDYLDLQGCPAVYPAVNELVSKLNPLEYKIIGSLKYEQTKNFTHMEANSIFIIKKL
jgi:hypothetical protein